MSPKRPHIRRSLSLLIATVATVATATPAASALGGVQAHASAAVAGRAVYLSGITSQGWPIVIKESGNGKKLSVVEAALWLSCSAGDQFAWPDGWFRLPVGSRGRVLIEAAQPPDKQLSIEGGTDSFRGRLNRSAETFTGVWEDQVTFSMPNGQSDSCDSGRVTFTARL